MKKELFNPKRREFLFKLLAGSALGTACISGIIPHVFAASSYSQGMQKVEGQVKINDVSAKIEDLVKPGDVITTGDKSMAVFVMGKSAFMLRENSRMELVSESSDKTLKDQVVHLLKITNGKLMAVFGQGQKRILTPSAIAGIRGTGVYIEVEPERSFFCTCYGVTDIQAADNPDMRKTVTAKHHDTPLYVYKTNIEHIRHKPSSPNHTDKELIMLENLVGRKPTFINDK